MAKNMPSFEVLPKNKVTRLSKSGKASPDTIKDALDKLRVGQVLTFPGNSKPNRSEYMNVYNRLKYRINLVKKKDPSKSFSFYRALNNKTKQLVYCVERTA
jgi:hypothetical protein